MSTSLIVVFFTQQRKWKGFQPRKVSKISPWNTLKQPAMRNCKNWNVTVFALMYFYKTLSPFFLFHYFFLFVPFSFLSLSLFYLLDFPFLRFSSFFFSYFLIFFYNCLFIYFWKKEILTYLKDSTPKKGVEWIRQNLKKKNTFKRRIRYCDF